jgi:hypothetical protein
MVNTGRITTDILFMPSASMPMAQDSEGRLAINEVRLHEAGDIGWQLFLGGVNEFGGGEDHGNM